MTKKTKTRKPAPPIRRQTVYPEGLLIKEIGVLSEAKMRNEGWFMRPYALQLSDGSLLYPSKDDEGNNAGTIAILPGSDANGYEVLAPLPARSMPGSLPYSPAGRKIVRARYTSLAGWHQSALALMLDDGVVLIPMSDEEGNHAGAWFGYYQGSTRSGAFTLPVRG